MKTAVERVLYAIVSGSFHKHGGNAGHFFAQIEDCSQGRRTGLPNFPSVPTILEPFVMAVKASAWLHFWCKRARICVLRRFFAKGMAPSLWGASSSAPARRDFWCRELLSSTKW